ncbi:MAG: NYN domain-containing protein [Actinobacteria bacterium]|nr:NYN domain-containing protein [Actinomycetota bacterium]
MKELYIIDGYNFIFSFYNKGVNNAKISSEDLSILRDRLINDLAQFKNYNKCELSVVFDAKHGRNKKQGREIIDSISVIYSKSGQTADSLVEKMVHLNEKYSRIFVVTSDYMQQKVIFTKNIYRKSIREFIMELDAFKKNIAMKLYRNEKDSSKSFYTIEKRLDKKTRQKLEEIRKK